MQALDVFTHLLLPVYIRKSLLDDDGVIRDGTDHAVVRPDAGSGANRIAFSVRCLHHGVVAESPPHDSHQTELCDAHALERREVEVLLSQVLALQNDCGERVPPPRRIVGIAELSCIRSRWRGGRRATGRRAPRDRGRSGGAEAIRPACRRSRLHGGDLGEPQRLNSVPRGQPSCGAYHPDHRHSGQHPSSKPPAVPIHRTSRTRDVASAIACSTYFAFAAGTGPLGSGGATNAANSNTLWITT